MKDVQGRGYTNNVDLERSRKAGIREEKQRHLGPDKGRSRSEDPTIHFTTIEEDEEAK